MDNQLQAWSQQFPAWVWNLGVAVSALLLGFILKLIITGILLFYKNREDYSLFKSIITHLGKPLNFLVPLLVLNFTLPLLKLAQIYLT
ncbi:MAG: mechanosensitive ion channel, partial [Mucilaginibacter sp.]|nr:mechanosensitive ion channel [Mucilaginibacter sp.]